MAVEKDKATTKLTYRVEDGTTASGGTKYTDRTISDINPEISDSDFLTIGKSISGLQTKTVQGIYRTDKAQIVEN